MEITNYVESPVFDFGTVDRGAIINWEFKIKGDHHEYIKSVVKSCGQCTIGIPSEDPSIIKGLLDVDKAVYIAEGTVGDVDVVKGITVEFHGAYPEWFKGEDGFYTKNGARTISLQIKGKLRV